MTNLLDDNDETTVLDNVGDIMTKAQAAALREKWAEGENLPCRHLHLELEHNNDDYLTDNYHCTACGELVAANTRDPFQVI